MTTSCKEERFKSIVDFDKPTDFEEWGENKFNNFVTANTYENELGLSLLVKRIPDDLRRQRFTQGESFYWIINYLIN